MNTTPHHNGPNGQPPGDANRDIDLNDFSESSETPISSGADDSPPPTTSRLENERWGAVDSDPSSSPDATPSPQQDRAHSSANPYGQFANQDHQNQPQQQPGPGNSGPGNQQKPTVAPQPEGPKSKMPLYVGMGAAALLLIGVGAYSLFDRGDAGDDGITVVPPSTSASETQESEPVESEEARGGDEVASDEEETADPSESEADTLGEDTVTLEEGLPPGESEGVYRGQIVRPPDGMLEATRSTDLDEAKKDALYLAIQGKESKEKVKKKLISNLSRGAYYPPEVAERAVNEIDVEWRELARLQGQNLLNIYNKYTDRDVRRVLQNSYEFTEEEVDYAVENLDFERR